MELNSRQLAIIKTISHFDVLDYPLTLLEIIRFSTEKLSAPEAKAELDSGQLQAIIEKKNGLYFLRGRQSLITLRHERYRSALKKLRRAQLAAAGLRYFPWIRAIAIYSSLSLKNSRTSGDIDLFFIIAPNRAWSARFFINLILTVLRLRPQPNNTQDKLCTSYFIDENNLDLSTTNEDCDYYYAYGTAAFIFLAGDNQIIDNFFSANKWISDFLPNWQPTESIIKTANNSLGLKWQKLSEKIFGLIKEKYYRRKQLEILPKKYSQNNDHKRVWLADGIIKTHDNDKRHKFNQLFEDNFNKTINPIHGEII